MKVFGVIPAAGKGTRLSPLPFSKELYPIGYMKSQDKLCPRPVSHYLLEAFKKADITDIFWITSENKTDIQKYYKSGSRFEMNFCYLQQDHAKGMVDAIRCVDPWLPQTNDYLIALGMPDTLIYPTDLFGKMKSCLETHSHLDIVLGLFQTDQWHKLGMVHFKEESAVPLITNIEDKPKRKPKTEYAWGIAMWKPSFQMFLQKNTQTIIMDGEFTLSEAVNMAIQNGLKAGAVMGSQFIDIGTMDDLQKTVGRINQMSFGDQHEC